MSLDRQLRVHVMDVHAVYAAEWHSLIRRAGHSVSPKPEGADLHLCMSPHFGTRKTEAWLRLAETGKPVILGRANYSLASPRGIQTALELGIRNHIIAHAGFAERIRLTATREGFPPVEVTHIPKCCDFDPQACETFNTTPPLQSPAANPETLTNVVTLMW